MAKFKEKIKARELRRRGESVKDIARKLSVSKGSVSIWCRDIELTPKQIARLHEKMVKGNYRGAIIGARIQRGKRMKEVDRLEKEGAELIGMLSERDLLLFGAGLYLGDGSKQKRARITNSNPGIIKFAVKWFQRVWGIPKEQFTLQVFINKIHKRRVSEVERYWLRVTGIPKSQLNKTILIKVKNKKIYKNFEDHYGTLAITIQRSEDLRHKISGLMTAAIKESNKLK